ncbi:MAG: alpha/beta fold hydrolase [Synechococcales bacterium]|nr:alpha/beta fold hydrolase [Synechococcales bacterium]
MRFIYNIDQNLVLPFKSLQNSEIGVVLIHGLNSTPFEMNHIAECLAHQGYAAHSMKIPGHASHPSDLLDVTWHEWVAATVDAVNEIRNYCAKVLVVGQCAGGVLGLYASTVTPIDGLILTAPVLSVSKSARYLISLATAVGKKYRTWKPTLDQMEGVNWFGYYTHPISVHRNFVELQDVVWQKLSEISSPILIIKSKGDQMISQEQVSAIQQQPGAKVTLVEIDGSAHLLTLNKDVKDQVTDIIMKYIKTEGE